MAVSVSERRRQTALKGWRTALVAEMCMCVACIGLCVGALVGVDGPLVTALVALVAFCALGALVTAAAALYGLRGS